MLCLSTGVDRGWYDFHDSVQMLVESVVSCPQSTDGSLIRSYYASKMYTWSVAINRSAIRYQSFPFYVDLFVIAMHPVLPMLLYCPFVISWFSLTFIYFRNNSKIE